MDGYTYINIFETKGIEYIVIIVFLLSLIPFWVILNKKEEMKSEFRKAVHQLSSKIMNIPHGLYYSKNHTWTHMEKSGIAKMGLDDVLLHITGNVKINYLKGPDEFIGKGDLIAEIKQNGRHLKIFSPVSGKILEINSLLIEMPGIIHEDPYDKGWLYSIRPSDWKAETQAYYLAEEAKSWLYKEMERIKDFIAVKSEEYSPSPVPVILQDGGELGHSLLTDMPDELWQDFQREFLDPL
jgi:glycine cleavage system H protein